MQSRCPDRIDFSRVPACTNMWRWDRNGIFLELLAAARRSRGRSDCCVPEAVGVLRDADRVVGVTYRGSYGHPGDARRADSPPATAARRSCARRRSGAARFPGATDGTCGGFRLSAAGRRPRGLAACWTPDLPPSRSTGVIYYQIAYTSSKKGIRRPTPGAGIDACTHLLAWYLGWPPVSSALTSFDT